MDSNNDDQCKQLATQQPQSQNNGFMDYVRNNKLIVLIVIIILIAIIWWFYGRKNKTTTTTITPTGQGVTVTRSRCGNTA